MRAPLLLLALALIVGLLKTFYGPAAVNGATLLAVVLIIWALESGRRALLAQHQKENPHG